MRYQVWAFDTGGFPGATPLGTFSTFAEMVAEINDALGSYNVKELFLLAVKGTEGSHPFPEVIRLVDMPTYPYAGDFIQNMDYVRLQAYLAGYHKQP